MECSYNGEAMLSLTVSTNLNQTFIIGLLGKQCYICYILVIIFAMKTHGMFYH